jgi:hypothetical protein
MNGNEQKIEIIKPFEDAFELMKKILFQPFNFEKWLVLGFAAFLAYFNIGGFGGFRFPVTHGWSNRGGGQSESFRAFIDQLGPIWWIIIGAIVVFSLGLMVLLSWVRARGHFIYIDCIVRNRGAIVQPWKEYRAEGNSYFLFSLCLIFVILFLVAIFAFAIVGLGLVAQEKHSALFLLPLILLAVIFPVLLVFFAIFQFVAPVMYRRRCKAWPAFTDLLSLFGEHLGVFVLYLLFSIVVGIGVAITALIAICATCCIAVIPYVGTVILLPIYVFMQSFSLLFLRQFGPDYDVWAALPATEPPPIQPPPLPA